MKHGVATRERDAAMIGLLYESDEWSDHKLAAELRACGCPVTMVDMRDAAAVDCALACDFLVSRVFASAQFRGNKEALVRMEALVEEALARGIPLVNPARAHGFEVDKRRAAEELACAGMVVPEVLACARPAGIDAGGLRYPCIIKPNCGGRTTFTAVARNQDEARAFLDGAPDILFIVEEYVKPERGFITRVELVDGTCALVVKRSVVAGGLSAYRLGSTYALYGDCPQEVLDAACRAGEALSIRHGSFDIIECARGACFIDANSVSNVTEDCTDTFGLDLMRAHARAIAREYRRFCQHGGGADGQDRRSGGA